MPLNQTRRADNLFCAAARFRALGGEKSVLASVNVARQNHSLMASRRISRSRVRCCLAVKDLARTFGECRIASGRPSALLWRVQRTGCRQLA